MESLIDADFQAWQATVPKSITNDVMWKSVAYRMALFAPVWVAPDIRRLATNASSADAADQIDRAVSSISANFSEGYARSGGRDRVRFYEYSLGSGRECRDRWFKLREQIEEDRFLAGLELFTRIVQILTAVVNSERGRTIGRSRPRRPKPDRSANSAPQDDAGNSTAG